jgi:peptide subunit release factor 1 (eRF1)
MKTFPQRNNAEDTKLFNKFKRIVSRKKKQRAAEEFSRSLDVVDWVLQEARDLRIEVEVVTFALKFMKEDPDLDISTAMMAAYDNWVK